jgi:hypothetical protein
MASCCLPQQTWEAKYSAFTVAELGERLPAIVSKEGIKYFQHTIRNHKNEYALEYSYQGVFLCAFSWYKNEAEIRSKMLIHLIENKSLEH